MNAHPSRLVMVLLVLLFSLFPGLTQAQGPGPDETGAPAAVALAGDAANVDGAGDATATALLSNAIPVQGYLTDTSGTPLSGAYTVTRSIYDVATGGTPLCSATGTVTASKGLFTTVITGCDDDVFHGRQLYLGITVGTDAEMTPRQPIYATPYARSVRPGAVVYQTETASRGLIVTSTGSGLNGVALWAHNINASPGGIGVWARTQGSDASIVAENLGTGQLFKGFGKDGGEDEFRVNNDGSIETKADSTIFVPGSALVKVSPNDSLRWFVQPGGAVHLWRGIAAGGKTVYFPLTIPTQLYGKAVEVESITVYYLVQDGAKGYISNTYLYKHTGAGSAETLILDGTDRTSTSAASYTLIPTGGTTLAPNQGLTASFYLEFADDASHVRIGGIEIRLGHHSLY